MIKLIDIKKSYTLWNQEIPVLNWISLDIKNWEFVAIMWQSWSGKSTLMNIIWLLDTPSSWKYILDGNNVEAISENKQSKIRWEKIGFVFQTYNLISRVPAIKQVSLPLSYQWVGKKEREKRAEEALIKVWLGDKINNKPNELSGWQQQRIAIARAFVIQPSIILADEPTGALDTKTWKEIMEILKSLNEEWKTIIIITHEPEIASYAKKIINLSDGLIINN